ncbi:MAG: hypothetical protein IJK49_00110 [Prevotella sp.]|nr:hypothetical protein [Prevotella sp.]
MKQRLLLIILALTTIIGIHARQNNIEKTINSFLGAEHVTLSCNKSSGTEEIDGVKEPIRWMYTRWTFSMPVNKKNNVLISSLANTYEKEKSNPKSDYVFYNKATTANETGKGDNKKSPIYLIRYASNIPPIWVTASSDKTLLIARKNKGAIRNIYVIECKIVDDEYTGYIYEVESQYNGTDMPTVSMFINEQPKLNSPENSPLKLQNYDEINPVNLIDFFHSKILKDPRNIGAVVGLTSSAQQLLESLDLTAIKEVLPKIEESYKMFSDATKKQFVAGSVNAIQVKALQDNLRETIKDLHNVLQNHDSDSINGKEPVNKSTQEHNYNTDRMSDKTNYAVQKIELLIKMYDSAGSVARQYKVIETIRSLCQKNNWTLRDKTKISSILYEFYKTISSEYEYIRNIIFSTIMELTKE